MAYKHAQLNIHDPHHSNKAGEILIQPGQTAEESDLYILLEIDSNTPEDKQLIKNFLEIAFEAYEKNKLFEPEKSLEKILNELNQYLPECLPKNKNFLNQLHCFVGLYLQGELTFSLHGKINTYLIKPASIKKINEKSPAEENSKIFDFTLNGRIKGDDRILITTESLTDYISLEKIKKTATTLPPASSIAHFTNILQATPPNVSFFSIILSAPQIKDTTELKTNGAPTNLSTPQTSKSSLDQLLLTQQETEKILKKPSLLQSLKNKTFSRPPETRGKSAPQSKERKTSTLGKFNKNLFMHLKTFSQFLILKDFRKNYFVKLQRKILELVKKLNRLPKINKILLIIVVIVVLIFTQNLIYQSRKQANLQEDQKYNEMIQQIESKQSSIEASLIYNDTSRAKQLLTEINELLATLPQNSKDKIAKAEQLSETNQNFYEKIWKVINIIEPIVLVDFRQLNLGATVYEIAIKDGYIYGLNSTNQLFLYSISNNEAKIENSFEVNLKHLSATPKNQLIGNDPEKRFYSLEPSGLLEITVSSLDANAQIDDLAFFLDKMYLLDKGAKQIYRFTNYANDYRAKRAWIAEDLPIDQVVSITIDGYIYALLENGEILKLATGKKQNYPKIIVEPELASATKIFTAEGSANLYILDSANQRFLIIDKEKGELKNQYYSKKFTDLKDFIIVENENKIYLLNDSQVVVVGI